MLRIPTVDAEQSYMLTKGRCLAYLRYMQSKATCRAELYAEHTYGLEKLHADQSYMLTRAIAYLQSMQCRVTVKTESTQGDSEGSYR